VLTKRRVLLLQSLYTVWSERLLMEEIDYSVAATGRLPLTKGPQSRSQNLNFEQQ
jgi:hypothetical protein